MQDTFVMVVVAVTAANGATTTVAVAVHPLLSVILIWYVPAAVNGIVNGEAGATMAVPKPVPELTW